MVPTSTHMLLINPLRLSEEDFTEISDAKRWPAMKYLQGGPKSGTLFKYVMQLHVIFCSNTQLIIYIERWKLLDNDVI